MKNKVLSTIITTILASCYLFPFNVTLAAGLNTKMAMAGIALVLLAIQMTKKRDAKVDKHLFNLSIIAALFSLACLCAVVYNETYDYVYCTYIISMWVWIAGGYTLVRAIKWLHGNVSVQKICDLLIIVGVAQCIIALLIDRYPIVLNYLSYIASGIKDTGRWCEGRLYGLGCAFDVAGIRFSCILVMLAFFLCKTIKTEQYNPYRILWYWTAFGIITVIGNMISRTTIIGVALFLGYLTYFYVFGLSRGSDARRRLTNWFLIFLCIAIPIVTFYYQTDASFHQYLRFAFEGFFSLAEKGEWDVGSNDILWTMYRFPETAKTWIIGDGYINSAEVDPYYTGTHYLGYYKGTDVGYLRFIYYCGLIGLITFCIYFIAVYSSCASKFPKYRILFFMLLMVNFLVWFKVATDAFNAFAVFLALDIIDNMKAEEENLLTLENG